MRHRPFFDGLRAVAIFFVMAFHGLGPFSTLVLGRCGWIGVDDFFVISGFLITMMLLGEKNSEIHVSLSNFYGRRAFRILPSLYLFIGIVYFWYFIGNHQSAFGSIIIAILGLTDLDIGYGWGFIRATGHLYMTWSLCVEEKFYLLYPLFLLSNKEKRVHWLIFLVLLIQLWKVYLIVFLKCPYIRLAAPFDTKCDTILIGCIFAILCRNPELEAIMKPVLSRKVVKALLVTLLVLSVYFAGIFYESNELLHRLLFWNLIMPTHCILVGILVMTLFFDTWTSLRRVLENSVVVWFGRISYSMYLWHVYIFGLVDRVIAPVFSISPEAPILELVRFWLSLSVAVSAYHFVELPLRQVGYLIFGKTNDAPNSPQKTSN